MCRLPQPGLLRPLSSEPDRSVSLVRGTLRDFETKSHVSDPRASPARAHPVNQSLHVVIVRHGSRIAVRPLQFASRGCIVLSWGKAGRQRLRVRRMQ
eukprot:1434433-Pleurochrysis_carterae.AAC.4